MFRKVLILEQLLWIQPCEAYPEGKLLGLTDQGEIWEHEPINDLWFEREVRTMENPK